MVNTTCHHMTSRLDFQIWPCLAIIGRHDGFVGPREVKKRKSPWHPGDRWSRIFQKWVFTMLHLQYTFTIWKVPLNGGFQIFHTCERLMGCSLEWQTAAETKTQRYTKSMFFFDKRAAVTYSEVTTPLTYPDLKKSMFKQISSFNGNMYRHIYIYIFDKNT